MFLTVWVPSTVSSRSCLYFLTKYMVSCRRRAWEGEVFGSLKGGAVRSRVSFGSFCLCDRRTDRSYPGKVSSFY